MLPDSLREISHALRALRQTPGFTVATVLTLGLAIGANSAMYSIVDGVLLRPLPFDRNSRLVELEMRDPRGARAYASQPDLDDWRAMAKSFAGLASWVPQSVTLTGIDQPERLIGMFVSADFLPVLGIAPAIGRNFAAGEDRPGGMRVVILSDGIWRSRFGGDPGILGKTFQFNGEPYTVIGVLPSGFIFPHIQPDVYLPMFKYPNYSLSRARESGAVIGRLKPGASLESAQAEMNGIAARLSAAYPDADAGRTIAVLSLRDNIVARRRPLLIALAWAVLFVLLIGCANIAGLMIARMIARERERAVRLALGASRARLFWQVAAEVGVLGVAGGALGLLLAAWIVPVIAGAVPVFLPNGIVIELNGGAVAFTAGIALAAAFFIAIVPAWQSVTFDALRAGRGSGGSIRKSRVRAVLVAGEIALALALLAGAGLTMKSVTEIGRQQPGFDPRNLLTVSYRVPRSRYATGEQQTAFHRAVVEQIKAVPGIVSAAAVRAAPVAGNVNFDDFWVADRPEPPLAARPRSILDFADPGFFATMRVPLLRGRVFTDHDAPGAAYVVIVNETLERLFFPDRNPIGQRLRLPSLNQTAEIVGVVGDFKEFDLRDPDTPQIWGALAQNPFVYTDVVVRTAGDPLAMVNSIRRAVWQLDRDQPVWSVESFEEILGRIGAHGLPTLVADVLGVYAGLALALASIGIFGLVNYSVSQRTGEIGVRVALGAAPSDILGLVLGQGLWLGVIGIAAGAGAAVWLARYLQAQLFNTSPFDPAVYAIVATLLLGVVTLASVVPARRALHIQPSEALRQE